MNRSWISALTIALGISVVGLSSCAPYTVNIAMNPQVPNDIRVRLPFTVGLYLSPEFEMYHWRESDVKNQRTLDYDLGSASKALFLQTFMDMTREIRMVSRKPPYIGPDEPAVAIVIEPQIVGFGQEHPAYFIYLAHIEYRVIVYDRTGAILLDKIYRGDGEAQGEIERYMASDLNFIIMTYNFAAPAKIAMSRAIAALLNDVSQLSVGP